MIYSNFATTRKTDKLIILETTRDLTKLKIHYSTESEVSLCSGYKLYSTQPASILRPTQPRFQSSSAKYQFWHHPNKLRGKIRLQLQASLSHSIAHQRLGTRLRPTVTRLVALDRSSVFCTFKWIDWQIIHKICISPGLRMDTAQRNWQRYSCLLRISWIFSCPSTENP